MALRVVSWNVNGLRACARKGFLSWLEGEGADLVGLQEVRSRPEQLDVSLAEPPGWCTAFSPAARAGYSGVALYSRRPWDDLKTELGDASFDAEGRLQIVRFGNLVVANVYFPNGSGRDRDNGRVPYKLAFYSRLEEVLRGLRAEGYAVVVMGDFNTAPSAIDLARPKTNESTSGFLPEERAEIERWYTLGWTDAFRALRGPVEGVYTWWSQRAGARDNNVGWRIDYFLACPRALPFVEEVTVHPEVRASDHCPIGLVLRDEVMTVADA